MSLDVLSERGQESIEQENRAIEIFESCYLSHRYVRTPKSQPPRLDGVVLQKGKLYAVAECKCRPTLTYAQLFGQFGGEWLVTWSKVQAGLTAFELFNVGMIGLLYLLPDDVVLLVRIVDDNGHLVPKVRVAATETQRTINGGTIIRNNAYIDMSKAKTIRFNSGAMT